MAQVEFDCFAVTPPGTEKICAAEIKALGIACRVEAGGVSFVAPAPGLYRVNLWSRVASRVLVRLGSFKCRDFPELHRRLLKLPWGRFIRPGRKCAVRVSCHASRLIHTGRIAETLLAALEKNLGAAGAGSVAPEQLIFVRFENDQCMVSIDSSGELLHRRGYRKAMVAAPLRENLAAAILLKLGYDGSRPLIDAMTGSGTFAIEAALIAAGVAPGRNRIFSFMDWPHYKSHVWNLCLQEQGIQPGAAGRILAIDCEPKAVAAALQNARAAQVEHLIRFEEGRMEELVPTHKTGLLVINPPYGERLGDAAALTGLYADFGQLCTGPFAAWTIGWLSSERRFERTARIGCQRLWSFSNGGIKVEVRQRTGRGVS
ncbi:MAG: THUMP domain-containing protein, partial [Geopsychrobacter sp.]|nr:THUMP domain-containing protein [Geopsychrobacter sp.]